jgi:hypothetical protein
VCGSSTARPRSSGWDLSAGETNNAQSGTELIVNPRDGHLGSGNDFIFQVKPGLLLDPVDGIRGFANGGARGVTGVGQTGVFGKGSDVGVVADGAGDGVRSTGGTGAGVIGFAGGASATPGETEGVGVYGNGGIGVRGQSNGGTGGVFESPKGVGVKGQSDIDAGGIFESDKGIGVKGKSRTGAGGDFESVRGAGVHARSKGSGRGAVFESLLAAQVQLIPHQPVDEIPDQPFPVRALNPKGREKSLPATAQAGDLICTNMKTTTTGRLVAALWFCVTAGDKTDPARWRQVLLGPEFKGDG